VLPEAICEFFQQNHIMCLATVSDGQSYSTPLFYYFHGEDHSLCFLSSLKTRHARELLQNQNVSAAIYAPHRDMARLQGVQMTGSVRMHDPEVFQTLSAFAGYRERFPECGPLLGDLELRFWTFHPDWIKFTDNTIRFGYKQIWSRS
jgi:uncharacterized protein YhbP (UPF0306 family)